MQTGGHVKAIGLPSIDISIFELLLSVDVELANIVIFTFSIATRDEADGTTLLKINRGLKGGCRARHAGIATSQAVSTEPTHRVYFDRIHDPRIGVIIHPVGGNGPVLEIKMRLIQIHAPEHPYG